MSWKQKLKKFFEVTNLKMLSDEKLKQRIKYQKYYVDALSVIWIVGFFGSFLATAPYLREAAPIIASQNLKGFDALQTQAGPLAMMGLLIGTSAFLFLNLGFFSYFEIKERDRRELKKEILAEIQNVKQ
jgi:hypothetical protein